MSEDKNESTKKKKKSKVKGDVVIIEERCKGCGFCVEFCPTDVLKMADHYNEKGYHPPEIVDIDACTGCELCGMFCPDFAIYGFRVDKKKKEDDAA